MRFSERTAWDTAASDFAQRTEAARQRAGFADLTVSNPTHCGFTYPVGLLAPLADPAAAVYEPEPLGTPAARAAVVRYYADHGATVRPDRVCLTTSTSEAYSFLFRLLCDPGDDVLVAQPSYPLFDFIARLDGVLLREFPLAVDPGATGSEQAWSIDLDELEQRVGERTRALILVHPNNPTGHFVSPAERAAVQAFCARRGIALLVDEVFLDYALEPGLATTFAGGASEALCFVLSGISKVCGLPQMKASWIVAAGPDAAADAAMARLEVIADTFLSMNAPVQHALPSWLAGRSLLQGEIVDRVRANLLALDERLAGTQAARMHVEGGWTAVLRVPRTVECLPFADAALQRGVLVQPGRFYGLGAGRVVISLLTPAESFAAGLARLPID